MELMISDPVMTSSFNKVLQLLFTESGGIEQSRKRLESLRNLLTAR
jgi:hypothetical protein